MKKLFTFYYRLQQLCLSTFTIVGILLFVTYFMRSAYASSTPPTGKFTPTIYIVDKQAEDGFNTIQSAIDASLKDKEVVILIKPGKYQEKLYITRNNLTLVGSSQDNTIIEYAELRKNWRSNHNSDWFQQTGDYIKSLLEHDNKRYNMRWNAAMVGDIHRVLMRGGIFLYPEDKRQGHHDGKLRLLYEGFPMALLIQQANGLATSGKENLLDSQLVSLHQRKPFIAGSRDEVSI